MISYIFRKIHFFLVRGSPEKRYGPRGSQKIKQKKTHFFCQKIKVCSDFNSIYFLVPGLLFDQKFGFLIKLNMQSAQISSILVIFVFSFFEILKIVTKIWNLTPKVSIDFFNSIYFLVPGLIFDQKFGFLIKLIMRSAKISWILVVFAFIVFQNFEIC